MVAKIRGYFDPINDNLWKCCACSKQLNGKNSSNLKQHLKVRHPDIYTEFCGDNGKPSEDDSSTIQHDSHTDETIMSDQETTAATASPSTSTSGPSLIKDYFDHVGGELWRCSVCELQIPITSIKHLHQHFQLHPTSYKQFLDKLSQHRTRKHPPSLPLKRKPPVFTYASVKRPRKVVQSTTRPVRVKTEESDFEAFDDEMEEELEGEEVTDPVADDNGLPKPAIEYVSVPNRHPEAAEATPIKSTDPLRMFFQTMYVTVKDMPQEERFLLRRKIFEAVSEVEEQLHFRRNNNNNNVQ